MKRWLAWLSVVERIDRRVLFVAMAAAIVLPLLFPLGLPVTPRPEVRAVYDAIDRLPPRAPVVVAADYDPASKPEVQPFLEAFLELAFRKDLRVLVLSTWPQTPPLVEAAFARVAPRHRKSYGADFANLGFMEGKLFVISKVGESLASAYPKDHHGTPIRELPVMAGVEKLGDAALLVCVSAGWPGAYEWVPLVHGRYIQRIVASVVSVMGPDMMPFLGSGQIQGLVSGMAGAAQFETLVGVKGTGTAGMDAQSFAHLFIIFAVVLANVAYLATRRRRS